MIDCVIIYINIQYRVIYKYYKVMRNTVMLFYKKKNHSVSIKALPYYEWYAAS